MSASLDFALAAWAEASAQGLPFAFRGVGHSMWPVLRPADITWFTPLAGGASPRRGEIILYRGPTTLVAHRLLGEHPDGTLRLRGDFCGEDDPPVPRAALLGRLARVERSHGGFASPESLSLRIAAVTLPLLHERAPVVIASLRTVARLASSARRRLESVRRQR